MNIQNTKIDPSSLTSFKEKLHKKITVISPKTISNIVRLINSSKRPIILVGGGARLSGSQNEILKLVTKTRIPVVASLLGLDSFPHDNASYIGMIGTYGNRCANIAIANSDLIIALGVRFDSRQTGTKPQTFARGAKLIHVDIDPTELNNKITADFPINCDIKEFLTFINKRIVNYDKANLKDWHNKIRALKNRHFDEQTHKNNEIHPNVFLKAVSNYMPDNAIICVDIGQNQMWAAQSLIIKKDQRFITQGGMGAMGSALSLAIGASFANPNRTIVVITGDGGFQLNTQELQTIYHYKLPIKIIMLNNKCYGMVKQFQEQYFNSRFQSTVLGYSDPNFQSVISAYKIPVNSLNKASKIDKAMKKFFSDTKASFIEVAIPQKIAVLPKLSVNMPVEDQDPRLSRKELQAIMDIDLLPTDKIAKKHSRK